MSIIDSVRKSLVPIHPEGYIFIAGFAIVAFLAALDFGHARLDRLYRHRLVRLFLSRSAARHAVARRPRGLAGRWRRLFHRLLSAAGGTRPWSRADAARLGVHERLRLPCEPRADHRTHLARSPIDRACSSTPISTRRATTMNATASSSKRRRGASASCRSPVLSPVASCPSSRRARRIGVGDRFGLIRFGSRVDVYMPTYARPTVAIGSRAIAGETVLADLTAQYASAVLQGRLTNGLTSSPA